MMEQPKASVVPGFFFGMLGGGCRLSGGRGPIIKHRTNGRCGPAEYRSSCTYPVGFVRRLWKTTAATRIDGMRQCRVYSKDHERSTRSLKTWHCGAA